MEIASVCTAVWWLRIRFSDGRLNYLLWAFQFLQETEAGVAQSV